MARDLLSVVDDHLQEAVDDGRTLLPGTPVDALKFLTALAADGVCISLVDREPGDGALVERIATAMFDAWNDAWNLSPAAASQAGESFKRRLYAETAITLLREEGWKS